MFVVIVGLVGFAWTSQAAEIQTATDHSAAAIVRLAVVETKGEERDRRLQRIEEKLDVLLERVPPGNGR